jgi:predicted alpha/beta-hydrolase family hydrolase
VEARSRTAPGLPPAAGGKPWGGRIPPHAPAAPPLAAVRGLVFVGFPLHPAGKPADARGAHLRDVTIPMLFLQGTRDELADLALLHPLVDQLGARASLRLFENADHAFHVPVRTGGNDAQLRAQMAGAVATWIATLR